VNPVTAMDSTAVEFMRGKNESRQQSQALPPLSNAKCPGQTRGRPGLDFSACSARRVLIPPARPATHSGPLNSLTLKNGAAYGIGSGLRPPGLPPSSLRDALSASLHKPASRVLIPPARPATHSGPLNSLTLKNGAAYGIGSGLRPPGLPPSSHPDSLSTSLHKPASRV